MKRSHMVKFLANHRQVVMICLIFIVNLMLVSPSLMPEIYKINPNDEAKYTESGWRLLRGDIRDLAWGPVVALVYAPVHLIAGDSPDWFMIETWAGRFILYTFLWWSILYLAFQFIEYFSPFVMVGVLCITTPFFVVLTNQSDAVFLGFSALALAHLIKYSQHRRLKNLALASMYVGLGALARVETILLVAMLTILSLILSRGKFPVIKPILTSILPVSGILGIYFLASFILSGSVNLGLSYKSYDSFEMNQAILTGGNIELARQETRRLFGTQEENHGSILRAILRNPSAFAERMYANAKTIPENYLSIFGKKLGPVLLFFAFIGIYGLIRKKAFIPLGIILVWAIHALISLGFLALHIIPQVSYLPLILGAAGITWLFDLETSPWERIFFSLISLIILVTSLITNKPAFLVGFMLVVFVLVLSWLAQLDWKYSQLTSQAILFTLLAGGLILREPFQFPNYPTLGVTTDELVIHYLEKSLPSQSMVLVPTPLHAIAAKMSYTTMDGIPDSVSTLEGFWSYLQGKNAQALLLTSRVRVRNDLYDLMEGGTGQYFELAFTSPDGDTRIFFVK